MSGKKQDEEAYNYINGEKGRVSSDANQTCMCLCAVTLK